MVARRCVGIIGGMGPDATVDLFRWIVRSTPATQDQDHLHIIVDCDPSVPDRTAAILGEGPSPLPTLIAMARRLEAAGAELLVMACNTAHFYYNELVASVGIPILHMPREAVRALKVLAPYARKVGVLATTGTVLSGVYHTALDEHGFHVVVPSQAAQARLMEAIYGRDGIKAGNFGEGPREAILAVARELIACGADAIVLGCTEIPLVVKPTDFPVPTVDATEAVAKAVVREALFTTETEG